MQSKHNMLFPLAVMGYNIRETTNKKGWVSMEQFFASLMEFFNGNSVWTYLFIFSGKVVEVSISTLRVMLINRGERVKGVIAAIFEYALWLFVTGTVLSNFQSDALKIVFLIAAFAAGNFVGSWIEEKLAFGVCTISVYTNSVDEARKLAVILRENGHAVTLMDAEGINEAEREILTLTVHRKNSQDVLKLINDNNPNAMVTVENMADVKGGFMKNAARRSIGLPAGLFRKKSK